MAKNGTLLSCSSVNRLFNTSLDKIEDALPEAVWDDETSGRVLK